MDIRQRKATPPADSVGLFRALAEPTRQKLLRLLMIEELNVTELVTILRQPQSTISRHLQVLRNVSLVHDRKEGNTTLYHAADQRGDLANLLAEWLRTQPPSPTIEERLKRVLHDRKDEAVGFFDRLGKRWDDLRSAAFGDQFAAEAFVSLLPSEWAVADIGTGTGFLLPALAGHFQRVIAVDAASAMLECARQRITAHGYNNVTFHHGDLARLPIEAGSCDLAIACLVLHHLSDPAAAIAEIHRVLRPKGRLLLVEQEAHENQGFYETMQDRWWGFDPADLTSQVSSAGFTDVRQHRLVTAKPASGTVESPNLFVVTALRKESAAGKNPKR